jgi:mannan endo-1,4-beta-mannosidase
VQKDFNREFDGVQLLRNIMDKAVGAGLNVMRAWAHAVSPEYALQPSPGQYREAVFRGLDYVLDEARKRKLKVMPP